MAIDVDGIIVGCIRLWPDKSEPGTIIWLKIHSLLQKTSVKKIGSRLMAAAMDAVQPEKVRLVTLGGHSGGIDVMGVVRQLYEKNGFVLVVLCDLLREDYVVIMRKVGRAQLFLGLMGVTWDLTWDRVS